jgi:hypothetical protein
MKSSANWRRIASDGGVAQGARLVLLPIDTGSVCRFAVIGVDGSIAVSGISFNPALGANLKRIRVRVVTTLAALTLPKVR